MKIEDLDESFRRELAPVAQANNEAFTVFARRNDAAAVAEVTARWRDAGREVLIINETAPPRPDGADP